MAAAGSQAKPDRNLALELVRVTEAAALAAARMIGMGDKEAADQAAVDAMRVVLETVHMDGIVVIGEGEKDEAPMLYNGVIDRPGEPSGAISVKYGWFLALLASLVMTVASAMRSSEHERARKPPGTI